MSSRYSRRTAEIETIQWTDTNAVELEGFAGMRFIALDPHALTDASEATASLTACTHECWSLMRPGDWVVKRGKDDFTVLSSEEFAGLYEPATEAIDSPRGKLDSGPTAGPQPDGRAADATQKHAWLFRFIEADAKESDFPSFAAALDAYVAALFPAPVAVPPAEPAIAETSVDPHPDNNSNTSLTLGGQQAVDEFTAYLQRRQACGPPRVSLWSVKEPS
ncbi:hypothetical protein [Streptomyces chartreusis]|uniref:hypothetical protein n=1 Tax=Streptomyces chartreusis TaxID=1969 RepID=UPI0037F8CC38